MLGRPPMHPSICPLLLSYRAALTVFAAEKEGCSQAGSLGPEKQGWAFPGGQPVPLPRAGRVALFLQFNSKGDFLLHLHSPLQSHWRVLIKLKPFIPYRKRVGRRLKITYLVREVLPGLLVHVWKLELITTVCPGV